MKTTIFKGFTCDLCKRKRFDEAEFEAGNNAEIPVTIHLCKAHSKEHEADDIAFQEKYGSRIDDLAYQNMISSADIGRMENEERGML